MKLGVPRIMQGQMVEYSYGWLDGDLFRRIWDRSDGTVVWARADDESAADLSEDGYDPGGTDYPPSVEEWVECPDPQQEARP